MNFVQCHAESDENVESSLKKSPLNNSLTSFDIQKILLIFVQRKLLERFLMNLEMDILLY